MMNSLKVSQSFIEYCQAGKNPCYLRLQESLLSVETPSSNWLGRFLFWIKRHTLWRDEYCLTRILDVVSKVPIKEVFLGTKRVEQELLLKFFCHLQSRIHHIRNVQLQRLFCSHFYYAASKDKEELLSPLKNGEIRPLPGLKINFIKPFSPAVIHFISCFATKETLEDLRRNAKDAPSKSLIVQQNKTLLEKWYQRRFAAEDLFATLLTSNRHLLFLDWENTFSDEALEDIAYLLSNHRQKALPQLQKVLDDMKNLIKANYMFLKDNPPSESERIEHMSKVALLDLQEINLQAPSLKEKLFIHDILYFGRKEQVTLLQRAVESHICYLSRLSRPLTKDIASLLYRITQCNAQRAKLENTMKNPAGSLTISWQKLTPSEEKERIEYILHRKPLRRQMKIRLIFLKEILKKNRDLLSEPNFFQAQVA
jgi:hypothetical protein